MPDPRWLAAVSIGHSSWYIESQLTCLKSRESPFPCNELALRCLLLPLAQLEVYLVLERTHARAWDLKSLAVAVALVPSIYEEVGGQSRRDVAVACDVDLEWYVGFGTATKASTPPSV